METVRAFVACLLDLGTTRRVADLSKALRRKADAAGWKASWVPPPNLHVTVKFLGDVDAGLVPALSDALARAAGGVAPLRLGVKGLDGFPAPARPRVIVLDVAQGREALAALAGAVDDALADVGMPREKRAFHGHVTLARVKQAGGALADLGPLDVDLGVSPVTELTLYRSDLLRQGAEYHVLSRHPLQGEPRV